jgi:hypothetical protein
MAVYALVVTALGRRAGRVRPQGTGRDSMPGPLP